MNITTFRKSSAAAVVAVLSLFSMYWWGAGHAYAAAVNKPSITTSAQSTSTNPIVLWGISDGQVGIKITGGASTATATATAQGKWAATVNLTPNATNTLSVVAINGTTTSSADTVAIKHFTQSNNSTSTNSTSTNSTSTTNTITAPVITSPGDSPFTATGTPLTFMGTADASSTITVTGGSATASTTTNGSGDWTLDVPLKASSTNNLSFTAKVGTTTSSATHFTVLFGVSSSTNSTSTEATSTTSTSTDENTNNNNNGGGNSNVENDDLNNPGAHAHHSSGDFNRPVETLTGVINVPPIVTVGQVLGASTSFLFNNNLTVGSRGTDVIALQTQLATWGYFKGPITGYFGPMTKASVVAFQKANNLPSTGFFGPMTRAVINAMLQS